MKIEVLYPQICCLYGDKGNTQFLQKCLPDAEFIFTQLNDKPLFLDQDIDLVCIYSMSEQSQELVLSRLMQYKTEIKAALEGDKTFFLLTGNAMEIFGNYIEREDGSKVDGLGVYDIYAKRHAPKRFNTLIKASFNDITLLSYTSRFADTYGITEDMCFAKVEIGTGSCPDSKIEGIYKGKVIATYMLGPILVANPDFSKWLFKQLGIDMPTLPFENALYEAYEAKRKEFQRPDLALD